MGDDVSYADDEYRTDERFPDDEVKRDMRIDSSGATAAVERHDSITYGTRLRSEVHDRRTLHDLRWPYSGSVVGGVTIEAGFPATHLLNRD